MQTLYPIVRRVRRSLWPETEANPPPQLEEGPAVVAPATAPDEGEVTRREVEPKRNHRRP